MNLWKKRLGHVPESLWEQTEIETLVLADNDLCDLSGQIGRLTRLRMLDLGHNRLTLLPDSLSDLRSLTDFLYLHDNRLSSLPASLQRLTEAAVLEHQRECVEEFPECVCGMASLIELRVSDNGLTSLPDSLARLVRLRELHLRNNKLTSLPKSIGALRELRQIDLRGNPVINLPDALCTLPRLEKLDLRWVPDLTLPGWAADLETRGCVIYR